MYIEFPCPVCQSPLALKNKTSGGQVNCPKCQKLILLPLESPLPRHHPDTPPFQKDQSYSAAEVTEAISRSVHPYLKDLETKVDLLDDAVEMVKIRNERIRELETISLKTQSELWALEADIVEEAEEPDPLPAGTPVTTDLPEKIGPESTDMDTLSAAAHEALKTTGRVLPEIAEVEKQLTSQLSSLKEGSAGLDEAGEWIKKCLDAITALSKKVEDLQSLSAKEDT